MYGSTGVTLVVDLTSGKIEKTTIEESYWKEFIGGSGVAARLFFENEDVKLDPLSPENPLYIMTGPLAGSKVPGSSRFAICAKSPLTGIWGESTCGGNFAPELKAAGYDAVIVRGVSDKPVTLVIDDDRVELIDAGRLWGKDAYETVDELKSVFPEGKAARVLSIGQAGENLVKFASVCNDKANFAGRCGMGAVMGSKKLKAVACRGTGQVAFKDEAALNEIRKRIYAQIKEAMPAQSLKEMGTNASMDLGMMTGDVPIKNYRVGEALEISAEIGGPTMTEKFLVKPGACTTCPISSKRVMKVESGKYKMEEGPGPEYETAAAFGTLCMNSNAESICKINEWCNRYAMDTITGGVTVAFALDCYDQGILTKQDTDGLELTWGNADVILELVHKIAKREGLGDILAEGSREAARRIGKGAEELTAEIKGLELPMHDPRGYHGLGLAYMMSNRGACHNVHLMHPIEQGVATWTDMGFSDNYDGQSDEGKGEVVKMSEDFGIQCNSLGLCVFEMWTFKSQDPVDLLNAIGGYDLNMDEYLKIGARTWLIKRALNNLMGITAADDRLPKKVLIPLEDGGAAGSVPDDKKLRQDYYAARGLDESGRPTRQTLESVGLGYVVDRLYA
ncbi:MAG: aldehyde ferredoxin oxidoreductase family protein [Deltaproteobacteria bacterium]|nr:aldehyde ferredoxin oxidoreductase family protein [Deltaproteobacteria bacterium]